MPNLHTIRHHQLTLDMSLNFSSLQYTPVRDLGFGGKPSLSDITHLSVNATGNRVINTRTDRSIRVWRVVHLRASNPTVIENAHRDAAIILWNTNTDTSFASVGRDSYVKLWNCSGRLEREIKVLKAKGAAVLEQIEYSADGELLCVVDTDGTLIFYNVGDTYSRMTLIKASAHVNDIKWTNRGHFYVIAALDNGTVEIFQPNLDKKSVKLVHTLKGHKSPVTCVSIDPRGRFIACGTKEGIASLWRTSDMLNFRALSKVDEEIAGIEVSRDGSFLAISYAQGSNINIYDWDTVEHLHEVPNCSAGKTGYLALKWFPHRASFAYVGDSGRVVEFAKKEQNSGK